ncbi:uncharacterized protein LOC131948054 [Physella acuta]|uniref:uncharacterized protein LOC131948054 n=1 Tax=Physella acuta TaxID=109671 RepID=UPI0027DD2527|nr:uncharacterized protein LOC131948054 [Physella acuta]XP_059165510.1 uncharacterized protein LOC131948054 [Physella acuta]
MERCVLGDDPFTQVSKSSEDVTMENSVDKQMKPLFYMMKSLQKLQENGELCDLKFELNNGCFTIHRLMFAIWSPAMKTMLHLQQPTSGHIRLNFSQHAVFEQFINFLYTGYLAEQITDIPALLLLASTFKVTYLLELCMEQLKENVNVDNVISTLCLAEKFQLSELQLHCVSFLQHNLPEVGQKQELRELTPAQINHFLESEHVSTLSPEIKLFLIISWLTEDVSDRQQYLVLLLKHINWSVVAKDFLEEISQTENFFTSNPSSLYLLLQTLHSSSIGLGPYEQQFSALRDEYSYLLSSVVSSSVVLGSGKPQAFKPVHFTFVKPTSDHIATEGHSHSPTEGHSHSPTEGHSDSATKGHSEAATEGRSEAATKGRSEAATEGRSKAAVMSSTCVEEMDQCLGSSTIQPLSDQTVGHVTTPAPTLALIRKMTEDNTSYKNSSKVCVDKSETNFTQCRILTHSNKPRSTQGKITNVKQHKAPVKLYENKKDNFRKKLGEATATVTSENIADGYGEGTERHGNNVEEHVCDSPDLKAENLLTRIKQEVLNIEEENDLDIDEDMRTVEQEKTEELIVNKVKTRAKKSSTLKDVNKTMSNRKKTSRKATKRKKRNPKVSFTCSDCDYTASSDALLKLHFKKAHSSNCFFSCSLCSFKCQWNKEYQNHMRQVHFPGPPFSCGQNGCDYKTDKFPQLVSHLRVHTDHRPFACSICLAAFRSRSNLYVHSKTHSADKKFQCPECSRTFTLKITLDQHMVTHSDLRPYLCDLCGFSTKFQSHLSSHKRIHTGDVYHCNFSACKYSTPKQSQLKSHMRSHLGIRSHVCSTCGKAFVEKSHLNRHERIHTSERPLTCSLCHYTSTRTDKLREHVKKHHSEPKATSGEVKRAGRQKNKSSQQGNAETQSLIEVVLVKNNKRARKGDVSSKDTNVSPETFSVGHGQPEVANTGQGNQASTSKNEKELSTVDILAKMGLILSSGGSAMFGYHGNLNLKSAPVEQVYPVEDLHPTYPQVESAQGGYHMSQVNSTVSSTGQLFNGASSSSQPVGLINYGLSNSTENQPHLQQTEEYGTIGDYLYS